jgi:simple sugar transport system substrate-binding protein
VSFDRAELLGRLAGVSAPGKSAFPSHPRWKFVFVSHLTTSPLFVPLQYGIQDACALVACGYSWTGSPTGDPSTVVKAVNSAVAAKADGIALPLLDPTLLDDPIDAALQAGIPVVAYQVMASGGKRRIAFVGQDAQAAGSKIGKRIARLVRRGRVSLFASDPSEAGLHLRARSALTAIRRSGLPVEADLVATTHDPYGASARVDKYVLDHPGVRGLFALEPVASEAIQRAMDKHGLRAKGVRAGGYGVFPETLDKITDGELDYTIDEQPYSQGFVPVLQLFLAKLSGGLLAPCDTTLALRFVTKANLTPYLAKTRYEGSSSKQRYPIR